MYLSRLAARIAVRRSENCTTVRSLRIQLGEEVGCYCTIAICTYEKILTYLYDDRKCGFRFEDARGRYLEMVQLLGFLSKEVPSQFLLPEARGWLGKK